MGNRDPNSPTHPGNREEVEGDATIVFDGILARALFPPFGIFIANFDIAVRTKNNRLDLRIPRIGILKWRT